MIPLLALNDRNILFTKKHYSLYILVPGTLKEPEILFVIRNTGQLILSTLLILQDIDIKCYQHRHSYKMSIAGAAVQILYGALAPANLAITNGSMLTAFYGFPKSWHKLLHCWPTGLSVRHVAYHCAKVLWVKSHIWQHCVIHKLLFWDWVVLCVPFIFVCKAGTAAQDVYPKRRDVFLKKM